MPETALHLIEQHGYLGLYVSLALGILGIPIPDETLLTFAGYLVFRGQLSYLPALLVCILGSLTGMSLSYWIGRLLGLPFIHRFGAYLHLTPERFDKGQVWFHRFGGKSIVFGYFVPGFRHLTAYVSGISKLEFPNFLWLASLGSSIWIIAFVTLGRVIGKDWARLGHLSQRYLGILALVVVLGLLLVHKLRPRKDRNL